MIDKPYIFDLDIDLKTLTNIPPIEVVASDKETDILLISIKNKKEIVDLTGYNVQLNITKSDDTAAIQDSASGVSIIDATLGLVQVVLKSQSINSVGSNYADVTIWNDEKQSTTNTFRFVVRPNKDTDEAAISANALSILETARNLKGVGEYDNDEPYLKNNIVHYVNASFMLLSDESKGVAPAIENLDIIWQLVARDGTGGGGGSGSAWHNGNGAPGSLVGVDGDYYLNVTNGDIYAKSLGSWAVIGNIKGPQGNPGNNGISVTGTSINGLGHLIVTLSNTNTIDAGKVTGNDGSAGVSVTSATINVSGNLILTLSNSSTIDCGHVVGADGVGGSTDISGLVPKTTTVNGHALSGNVTVSKDDIGLGNVNNTADIDKQVSTLQQAAIDAAITALKGGVAVDGDTLAKLRGLVAGLQTLVGSDDVSLDTLQEIVTYIKSNKTILDSVTTTKVSVSDIIDDFVHTDTNKPASANRAKVLNDLIVALTAVVALNTAARHNHTNKALLDTITAGGAANTFLSGDGTYKVVSSGGGGAVPACRVTHNVGQSIPTSALTALAFNTETYDTDSIHDTSTNNSRLTCKTPGKYKMHACVGLDGNATGTRELYIRLNGGSTYIAIDSRPPTGTSVPFCNIVGEYQLALNDYVEVMMQQTSGSFLSTLAYSGTPSFSMERIGD